MQHLQFVYRGTRYFILIVVVLLMCARRARRLTKIPLDCIQGGVRIQKSADDVRQSPNIYLHQALPLPQFRYFSEGEGRFLLRSTPIVTATTDHGNYRTFLFNERVNCEHSVDLRVMSIMISNSEPGSFSLECGAITTRLPRPSFIYIMIYK